MTDSIVARCTPQGSGALALIRISGSEAIAIADRCARLADGKQLREHATHTIHYGQCVDAASQLLDQVLFLLMRAPRTFTGEDTVEITCHNNQFIIEAVIAALLQAGARLAQPGEFTRRAYGNGKIDLIQAEAIDELVHAQSEHALKKSLAQLSGTFSHYIATFEQQLVKAIAWCEASFEFLDEGGDFVAEIKEQLMALRTEMTSLLQSYLSQRIMRQGVRVALIGSVNAGKSSLFNALLKHKRAIVSPQAGTTRDVIEASLVLQGHTVTFVDTAGLRLTHDTIEQEGIERSYAEAAQADIILLVFDASRTLTEPEQEIYDTLAAQYGGKVIRVMNKSDTLSALTGQGIAELESTLVSKMSEIFASASPFLLNKRQHHLLQRVVQHLDDALAHCTAAPAYEILSLKLQQALVNLSELTGKSVSEAALDAVFKEFCVGK